MAVAAASMQHFAAHDKTPRPAADPFWQSTPRTNSAGLASLMSAIQQVLPAPSTTTTPQKTTRHAMSRRPQCTHIYMNRVHGDLTCNMCGRIPEVGWVYACQQDRLPGQYDPLPDVDAVPVTVPDDSNYFDARARVAEYLHMSPSVIKGIRAGDYDIDQVEKLIKQREKVIRTINEQEVRLKEGSGSVSATSSPHNIITSVGSTAPAENCRNSTALPMSPAGTPANTPHDSHATTPVKGDGESTPRFKYNCTFQVCHACRPFFLDRMYISFESAFNGEGPSAPPQECQGLRVADARIISKIGQHAVPRPLPLPNIARPQPSMDIVTQSTSEVDDDISVDWSDSEHPSERLDSSELYPCPGPGQCPVWSRHSGCAYDVGFDDGRRAMNHGYFQEMDIDRLTPENSHSQLRHMTGSLTNTPIGTSSTASSLSLPTPTASNLAPLLPSDDLLSVTPQKQGKSGKAKSVCGEFDAYDRKVGLRGRPSSSSLGSEVEVEGGVALTEEAVESGTPDIITSQ
ncbi:hypothetical protein M409DRAFT_28094 [Zasmidium cellare ATCC 36951]|uniref:Uncharacterized protein n=1 Tax=Zasmidium cellare ATCC 36951 TaxID=1080233 RepID=A0A6A6C6I0_ZASCE|nr:uncharacterized protein M409DRAFT_28094 [Zasmidium cellare ATCC 36951]KAF2161359.1 hypothetical protein M409DRAFT_28094 [Zasmidium cellare ATCC 36951]